MRNSDNPNRLTLIKAGSDPRFFHTLPPPRADYTDWLDRHTVQQTTEGQRVRTGNSSDKRQYERWTEILGAERMPGSLDRFRDLKYYKKALFEQVTREKDTIEKIQNKSWTPEFKNKANIL